MDRERHETHNFWAERLRSHYKGDDAALQRDAKAIEALLASPGWAVMTELVDLAREVAIRSMTGSAVPSYGEFIAQSRAARAYAVVNGAGPTLLLVADEREQQLARDAAAGRGEA